MLATWLCRRLLKATEDWIRELIQALIDLRLLLSRHEMPRSYPSSCGWIYRIMGRLDLDFISHIQIDSHYGGAGLADPLKRCLVQ